MSTTAGLDANWARLGTVPPATLSDARRQLHHAAQIAVSATISYLPARSDDSHTALSWNRPARALATEPVPADGAFRIAVRVEDLTLLALDDADHATGSGSVRVADSFALAGHTIDEGHTWLRRVVAQRGLDPARLTARKHYSIPEHAVAGGAPFSLGSGVELRELERYWSNAAAILEDLARVTPNASPVLTWPHHFDIATLITLPPRGPERGVATIGVGQSPGDDSYDEPYWYVGPSPHPEARDLPPLQGGGHWHTTGWFGAALPASGYVAAPDQRARVLTFIDSAVAACRALLGVQ